MTGPPACAALLDPEGGALRVGPVRPGGSRARLPPSTLRYLPGTGVSSLVLDAGDRRVEVVDALPWPGAVGTPPGRLVRLVTALAGPVDVEVEYRPPWRPTPPRRVVVTPVGVVADRVVVRAGMPLEPHPIDRDHSAWRGVRRMETGDRMVVTLDRLDHDGHPELSPDAAATLVDATVAAWRWWVAPLSYAGPHRPAVERAVLAVRSLTGAHGAAVAAGTTSLPRWPGGERSADDRYVRLRDAAVAASVLRHAGLHDEAVAAEEWLRTAVEASVAPWPRALTPDASTPPGREELALAGWRGSQPVVTGRDDHLDLDLVGDVVGAVSASTGGDTRSGAVGGAAAGPLTGAWPALVAGVDALAGAWAGPDGGVWGLGGPPRHLTATRVQAWTAFDRMARLARGANPLDLDAPGWQQSARDVLAVLERDALAPDGGLKMAAGPDDHPDAALLRVAWAGPWPAGHPIVERTVDRILERLADGPWLARYPAELDDGTGGPDGVDVVASLWAVRAEAALGRWDAAHERLEAITAVAPLGVLAEAVDARSGQLLGNLPCTSAHLALTGAAAALEAGPT